MAPNEQRGKRLPSGQLLLLAQNKINVKGTTFIHIYEYIPPVHQCSNSEHWPQKHVQSGNIHSKILDVYVELRSAQTYGMQTCSN